MPLQWPNQTPKDDARLAPLTVRICFELLGDHCGNLLGAVGTLLRAQSLFGEPVGALLNVLESIVVSVGSFFHDASALTWKPCYTLLEDVGTAAGNLGGRTTSSNAFLFLCVCRFVSSTLLFLVLFCVSFRAFFVVFRFMYSSASHCVLATGPSQVRPSGIDQLKLPQLRLCRHKQKNKTIKSI